jgi:formyltetrahydrofolate deformylase
MSSDRLTPATGPNHVLLVECPDRRGLVHDITGVLLRHDCNVTSNHEFVETDAGQFFMRTEFSGEVEPSAVLRETKALLPAGGSAQLAPQRKRRVVVLVSREHHCLADLLVRHAFNEINAELLAVIGNHDSLGSLVRKFGIPFHHISHEGQTRDAHEASVLRLLDALQPEWLVLAKYMRILSGGFVARHARRMINIHHSFLPAFVGAKPYQQAFQRGVKVIGATAHFVTEQLDEGPIIVQQVIPVDHTHGAADMAQAGRDVEQMVLARALKLVFEDRVFLSGNRTIIFD